MKDRPLHILGVDQPCLIIAEAGVNHNGSLDRAKQLVEAAAVAGADAVKFQLYRVEEQVSGGAKTAGYQKSQTGEDSMAEMAKQYDLPWSCHAEIAEHCRQCGILYAASCFEPAAVDLVIELGAPFLKIASGELTNTRLLRYAAKQDLPILLSTGMSTYEDIAWAVGEIEQHGNPPLALFHCISSYPTKLTDVNLRVMQVLSETHQVPVGLSDHTEGHLAAIVAIGMGASMVEKHFTLDKSLPGPDHAMSLDPQELGTYVRSIRQAEQCLGDATQIVSEEEMVNAKVARRSLVSARTIEAGELFDESNTVLKRPGSGIDPREWGRVAGKTARCTIQADQLLTWDMVQ